MGWFEFALFVIGTAISLSQSTKSPGMPDLPGYIAPDLGPLNEQAAFTDYQDATRNKLLSEYFGGSQAGGRTTFGGQKPSRHYRKVQEGLLESSATDFSPELAEYLAARGMDSGDQVQGAQQELGDTYEQRSREINAKSHDIYALTLGSLFGEVSDTGLRAAQMAGAVGQASQMENARRDQSYNSAMQKWQYEQGKPNTWGTVGQLLPQLGMMLGGMNYGGANTYYGQAQTMQPGINYNTSVNGPSNTFNYS